MKSIFYISLLSLFILSFSKLGIEKYTPTTIVELINTWHVEDNYYKDFAENLIQVLDRYVFLDIIKNPKQPFPNYHTKVDLVAELKKFDNFPNFYTFYQKLRATLNLAHDAHFNTRFTEPPYQDTNITLNNLNMIQPVDYKIKKINGEIVVYAKLTKKFEKAVLEDIFGEELVQNIVNN